MKAKTIIKLVYLVCYFVRYTFVDYDRGLSNGALEDIRRLTDD